MACPNCDDVILCPSCAAEVERQLKASRALAAQQRQQQAEQAKPSEKLGWYQPQLAD